MTSWRGQHPTAALNVDLSKVDVTKTGFWWCSRCQRITELLELENGVRGERCAHCRSGRVEWKEGTPASSVVKRPTALPEFDWAADPAEPKPAQRLHRLASDKRDLRMLARCGYWFCYGCKEITEPDRHERCTLCHSDKVEWQEPVFKEAAQ